MGRAVGGVHWLQTDTICTLSACEATGSPFPSHLHSEVLMPPL